MNSAIAVAIGLTLAIILILKKCHPVYALILGAVVSGLMSGWGFAKSYDRNAWLSPKYAKSQPKSRQNVGFG